MIDITTFLLGFISRVVLRKFSHSLVASTYYKVFICCFNQVCIMKRCFNQYPCIKFLSSAAKFLVLIASLKAVSAVKDKFFIQCPICFRFCFIHVALFVRRFGRHISTFSTQIESLMIYFELSILNKLIDSCIIAASFLLVVANHCFISCSSSTTVLV